MNVIQSALNEVSEAKKSLKRAKEQLASEVMNCQDMPLKEAMAEGLVKFNFAVPRYFKERFTGIPDENRIRQEDRQYQNRKH